MKHFVIALLVIVATCATMRLHAAVDTADQAAAKSIDDSPYDHFIGWFHLRPVDRKTRKPLDRPGSLIPIMRRGEKFFTVFGWVEIPLKPDGDALVWNLLPSSMAGTRIEFDRKTWDYFLVHHDAQAANFDECYVRGERRLLERVKAPEWIPQQATDAPRSLQDFLGYHYFAWAPFLRYEVIEEKGRYWFEGSARNKNGEWKREPAAGKGALQPLDDSRGFLFLGDPSISLRFDENLKRYVVSKPGGLTIPLVREDPWRGMGWEEIQRQYGDFQIGIPGWRG